MIVQSLLLVENRDHDLHACSSEVFADGHLPTRSDGLREDLFNVLDFSSDHYYEVMPRCLYYSCSRRLMPFHAEVLIGGETNARAHAPKIKQETNWTFFSCTAIGISLSHDERTLSQSDSLPVVGASSGAYAVDSSQCKPRQDHERDSETTTTITAVRGKPPPRSLQHRSDTRHFGACPGP